MRISEVMFFLATLLQVKCQLLETAEALVELQQQQLEQQLNGGAGGGMGSQISNNIRRSFVHDGLSRATKFIVHQSATPSPDMMAFGMTMRRGPTTKEERDFYVHLMKKVARQTPALLVKYVKEEQHKNGTIERYIDYYGLEADVVRRALTYNTMISARRQARQNEQERTRQHELRIAELQANHTMNVYAALSGASNTANSTNNVKPLVVSDPSSNTNINAAAASSANYVNNNAVTPGYTHMGTTDLFYF